jgi:hypothetical protein
MTVTESSSLIDPERCEVTSGARLSVSVMDFRVADGEAVRHEQAS